MLGVTAERFPTGGPFLLGLMGCVGNLAIAAILPIMGSIYDDQTLAQFALGSADSSPRERKARPGEAARAAEADRRRRRGQRRQVGVPLRLGAPLGPWSFIFGAIALSDRARGGYKPEVLKGKELTPAELASDF